MNLLQNNRKFILAITLFVYLDSVTAQPGSILWAYVRRLAPDFLVGGNARRSGAGETTVTSHVPNNTTVIETTTQALNTSSSVIPDLRRAKMKMMQKATPRNPQSTRGEVVKQETIKYFVKTTKKITKDDVLLLHGKTPTVKAKHDDSVTNENNRDTKQSTNEIDKDIRGIVRHRPILRAKQHQAFVDSPEIIYEDQIPDQINTQPTSQTSLNLTEPPDNALDSEERDKTPTLRAKKHKKATTAIEASSSTEFENEQYIGNETKEAMKSEFDKDPDDMAEEKVTKKLRFRSKHKMTELPLQMQDPSMKADELPPNIGRTRNEHLNPYAINRQMTRFMEENGGNMNIKMEVIGRTVEYNDIILMKITEKEDKIFRSHKYAKDVPEKKIIFIVHGLSILGMGELIKDEDMFKTLMDSYTEHIDHFDIFVIPMANPDGFAAILNSQEGKFWNKNMSPQSNCAGVALDRNFDVEWNSSNDISSCSHVYPGPIPFSEAETRAIREVFHLYGHKIVAYIHVHASTYYSKIFKGDAILHPKGYSTDHNDDDKYIEIKADIEDSMKNASFKVLSVTVEPLFRWYGIVTGTSVDFASTVYGIPYAMEFCMQSYDDLEHDALYQIWRRIIDAAFSNIWKNINNKNSNLK